MIKQFLPKRIKVCLRNARARLLSVGLPRQALFEQPPEEAEASAEMSVIVPICDAPKVTARCLKSLASYAPQAEVILVDDGSSLPVTVDLLQSFQKRCGWKMVRHDSPKGHSRACEAGVRLASRPYLCFLNSDTVVTPWSWKAAKEAFEVDPTVAVTGPSSSETATPQAIARARHCRNYWTDSQIFAFAKRYVAGQPPRSWVDLGKVSGFAFFVRRELWNKVGGFDKTLPDYGNESELFKRLTKEGWRVIWTRNSYIHHFGNRSYGRLGREEVQRRRLAAQAYIDELYRDPGDVSDERPVKDNAAGVKSAE